jgi:uncharacterized repeat protein (TIGR03803 family)
VVHNFTGPVADGGNQAFAGLLLKNGKFYGTTFAGGSSDKGTIYQLAPPLPGSSTWRHSVLHNFPGGTKAGAHPLATLTLGKDGALYSMTEQGERLNSGTVFQDNALMRRWVL